MSGSVGGNGVDSIMNFCGTTTSAGGYLKRTVIHVPAGYMTSDLGSLAAIATASGATASPKKNRRDIFRRQSRSECPSSALSQCGQINIRSAQSFASKATSGDDPTDYPQRQVSRVAKQKAPSSQAQNQLRSKINQCLGLRSIHRSSKYLVNRGRCDRRRSRIEPARSDGTFRASPYTPSDPNASEDSPKCVEEPRAVR